MKELLEFFGGAGIIITMVLCFGYFATQSGERGFLFKKKDVDVVDIDE